MAKILSSAGINTGSPILPAQFTQVIDAFTGADAYDITVSGSLTSQGPIVATLGTSSFTHLEINNTVTLNNGAVFVDDSGQTILNSNGTYTGSFSGSYAGDGSGLTGVITTATAAGPTSSIQFRDGGATSTTGSGNFTFDKGSNTLTLTGSLTVSGSSTLTNIGTFSQTGTSNLVGQTTVTGSLIASGSSHTITGGTTISGSVVLQGGNVDSSTIAIIGGDISGSFSGSYQGDGTNIALLGSVGTHSDVKTAGSTGGVAHTPLDGNPLVWDETIGAFIPARDNTNITVTGSAVISGSLTQDGGVVDFTGATNISGSTFSGSFVGDGTGLTNVSAPWDGNRNGDSNITGSLTVSGSNVIIDALNARIVGDEISGSFSGSFAGDGSNLTGVTGEWDGSRSGSSSITGSLVISGSSVTLEAPNLQVSEEYQLVGDPDFIGGTGTYFGEAIKIGSTITTVGLIYALSGSGTTPQWRESTNAQGAAATASLAIASGISSSLGMITRGLVDVGYSASSNIGDPVYLSTAGSASSTVPTGTGEVVRLVGHYYGDTNIYFNPSNDFIKL